MKSFLRFVSRNRLYTVIEVAGMAIALAFIIFIGTYVTQERSYDTFVGDDVYVGSDAELFSLSGTVKGLWRAAIRISRLSAGQSAPCLSTGGT